MRSRTARVFVLLAVAFMMSAFGVYQGVGERGFTAVAVVPPIFAFLFACGCIAGALAWVRKGNAWRDAAGLAPSGPQTKTLLAIAAGGAALSALAGVASSAGARAKAAAPELHVDGHRVISRPLGLVLELPSEWDLLDIPVQAGANFVARHTPTNTVLGGFALTADRPSSIDATLSLMLEQKRAKYGAVDDIVWGEERLGELRARTVAFTVEMPAGRLRNLTWNATSGPYAVGFTCSGQAATFDVSEAKCRSTLATITLAPRR